MGQKLLAETVAVITPIGQYGPGVGKRQFNQGVCGFVNRDLASSQDKAERTSMIVASDVDLARKGAA